MTFDICTAPQRSAEWFQARTGRATGSRASDVCAFLKGGSEAAARRDYRLQLVCERLTGAPQEDGYINADMQRGIDLEPAARAAYEAETGRVAVETGFLSCREWLAGCSLDGHVEDFAGIVEIKCPRSATHLKYLRDGIPSDYKPQILHNLLVTGAKWCDFVSFDPRFPEDLRLVVCRYVRDDAEVDSYRAKLVDFLAGVERETSALLGWRAETELARA